MGGGSMRTIKEEQLQKQVDELIAERDLWKLEAKRWRDMYLEYDEMLEGQVKEAVSRLESVWEELESLKKKVQDDLLDT
jgi:transposase